MTPLTFVYNLSIILNNIVFGAEAGEFDYFPNRRARDKRYILLQSQSESDFPYFFLRPGEISLKFDLKLASCNRYFGILGQKRRSPIGGTQGGVGCRVGLGQYIQFCSANAGSFSIAVLTGLGSRRWFLILCTEAP